MVNLSKKLSKKYYPKNTPKNHPKITSKHPLKQPSKTLIFAQKFSTLTPTSKILLVPELSTKFSTPQNLNR
jgi:hypothetical protein